LGFGECDMFASHGILNKTVIPFRLTNNVSDAIGLTIVNGSSTSAIEQEVMLDFQNFLLNSFDSHNDWSNNLYPDEKTKLSTNTFSNAPLC
jgi:hypothetical protein